MGEKIFPGVEGMDGFDREAAVKLSEELSDIRASEELIQKTLQAASKSVPGAAEKKKVAYRKYFLGLCTAAALLLICLKAGMAGLYGHMGEGASGQNQASNYSPSVGFAADANRLEQNAGIINQDGFYSGESANSMKGAAGNMESWEGYPEEPEGNMESWEGYPEEPDGNMEVKEEYSMQEPESIGIGGIGEEEQAPFLELTKLLLDGGEAENVTEIGGFTGGVESADYWEFHYWGNGMEITCRLYPDGSLEAKLPQGDGDIYRAVSGWQGADLIWKILDEN